MRIQHPDPDFGRLEKVIRRQGEPDRVPFFELFADQQILEAVIGEPIPVETVRQPESHDPELASKFAGCWRNPGTQRAGDEQG